MLRPTLNTFRGIFRISEIKTKMKTNTKLTFVMCCHIFDRKSVAPSSVLFGADRRHGSSLAQIRSEFFFMTHLVNMFRGNGQILSAYSPGYFQCLVT